MFSHHAQNAVERSDAQRGVVWYGYAMMRGLFGLKNNVTALLMNDTVVPVVAETLNELAPGQISWQFHPKATISSRTKCSRTELGRFLG